MNRQEAQRRGREAEAIMLAGGFIEARAEHFGPWWRVYGVLPGDNEHVGTTAHQGDPQDPSDLARRLVALAAAKAIPPAASMEFEEIPEAAPTDEPTFPTETPATPDEPLTEFSHETSGESDPLEHAERDYAEAEAATGFADEPAEPAEPIDADFTELAIEPDALTDDFAGALLEGADLGAEVLEENEPEAPQDRFYGLDDLDRRRSLRIGDVMRYARSLMPYWTTNEDAALTELRNFAMGVSEGRWPNDPARQGELDLLEATLGQMSAIVKARDERVEFLEGASRAEIETFDPEADWPQF